jgi:hypothetical protein
MASPSTGCQPKPLYSTLRHRRQNASSHVLIVADIIRTVIVDQTPDSVAVLATIVVVRILLSWSLAVEIDGVWPWRKHDAAAASKLHAEDGSN